MLEIHAWNIGFVRGHIRNTWCARVTGDCDVRICMKKVTSLLRRFVGFMSRAVLSPFDTYPLSHMAGISSESMSATQGLAHDRPVWRRLFNTACRNSKEKTRVVYLRVCNILASQGWLVRVPVADRPDETWICQFIPRKVWTHAG